MATATRTTVLRKQNKAELAALKEAAKGKFYATQHGYDEYASIDPTTGRAIGGWVEGAYIPVTVVYATEILRDYHQKLEEGYTLHELGIQPFYGQSLQIYFYRPKAELDESLEKIYQSVTDSYNAEIVAENDRVVERQVQLLLAAEAKKTAEQQAKGQQETADRLRKEVEETLGCLRKQVVEVSGEIE